MFLDLLLSLYWTSFSVFFAIINVLVVFFLLEKLFHRFFSKEVDGKGLYAFISGCDSGFGYGAAYKLNERGVHVFAACLSPHAVDGFNQDENFVGKAFVMDVTKAEDIERMRRLIADTVKDQGLSVLVNNAGVGQGGPIEWLTEEEMRRTCEVNLWGHVNVTKALLPMIKRAHGRVINTTSMLGRVTIHGVSSYCISKYALEAFSDALRLEMKVWGVSVHIIEPGFMKTNIYRQGSRICQQLWDRQTKEVQDAYGEEFFQHGLKHVDPDAIDKLAGDPKCVVDAYVHAALSTHPRARYLLGVDAHILAFTMGLLPTWIGDLFHDLLIPRCKPAAAVN